MKIYSLLSLVSLLLCGLQLQFLLARAAAAGEGDSNTNTDTVICESGFLPGRHVVIPADRINDGYCDCPLDGSDEPHTEACSGSLVGGWAGIASTGRQDGLRFTCGPQQPNLLLPVSRIHDGICDCCDGSDEEEEEDSSSSSMLLLLIKKCPNTCDAVQREERQRRRQLEQDFKRGQARRLEELANFKTVMKETREELASVMTQHSNLTPPLAQVEQEIQTLKLGALKQRQQIVQQTIASLDSTTSSEWKGLFTSLSEKELVTIIVQACQLAGELGYDAEEDSSSSSSSSSKTCAPLRLAGVDAGLVWGDEDFQAGSVSLERLDLESTVWADLVDRNAAGDAGWSVRDQKNRDQKKKPRRRLTEEDKEDWDRDDDYVQDDDDGNDDPDYDEADYPYEEPDEYEHPTPVSSNSNNVEKNEELYDKIKSFPFSATRVTFLKESSAIIDKIEELTKEADEKADEKEDDDDDAKETETRNETETPPVDPMALQMVASTLRRRVGAIQRGLDYAASATILVQDMQEHRNDLISLAAGTLYHGKIRSVDLWQMLAYMTIDMPDESCFSPFAVLCPPPHVTERNGTPYPPPAIVKAAQQYCQAAQDTEANVCAENSNEGDIPGSIPDNYYGYTAAQPRDEDDALGQALAPLGSYGDRAPLVQCMGKRNDLQEKQASLEKQRKQLEDKMGGRDHSKFGHQGELYALRDTCHSVNEGKYTYEVCIFGRAQQKDLDGASGTQLGTWHKMKVDPETGARTMEWTGGAKCWNGPERSATVHVTCGAEEKVLSAEEPDTCRYVLEMTSHIACDDNYKQRHGL
jgi:protein kinase C substrate 80K-H